MSLHHLQLKTVILYLIDSVDASDFILVLGLHNLREVLQISGEHRCCKHGKVGDVFRLKSTQRTPLHIIFFGRAIDIFFILSKLPK